MRAGTHEDLDVSQSTNAMQRTALVPIIAVLSPALAKVTPLLPDVYSSG